MFRSAPSQAETAVTPSRSAQDPGRQVDLFSCLTDRQENGSRQPAEAEPMRPREEGRQVLTTLCSVHLMAHIVHRLYKLSAAQAGRYREANSQWHVYYIGFLLVIK